MADVTSTLNSWSSTAASNLPANSAAVGPNTLADNQRTIQAVVRDAVAGDGTIVSAATTDLSTVNANYINVTGTTGPITAFGTLTAGIVKTLKFASTPTITHNATSLILPNSANIVAAAGDVLVMRSEGSGNWRCLDYQPAGGNARAGALASSGITGAAASGANADITSMTALTAINRTGGTSIKGTNTNNNAAAGDVGEYIESTIAVGSAVSLTTGVTANITSISLTAGDWDVSGVIIMDSGATTNVTRVSAGTSSTSATADTTKGYYSHIHSGYVHGGGQFRAMPLNTSRFSLSGTTTIYLVALANFTVSTCTAYGTISARRVR